MMTTAEGSAELDLPVEAAFRLITDFTTYPVFLEGIDSVRRVDDGHLEWVGSLDGRRRSWRATITELAPDTSVAWTSQGGPSHSGVLALEPIAADRTRVTVRLDYEGDGEGIDLEGLEALAARRAPWAPEPAEPRAASLAAALGAPVGDVLGEPLGTLADVYLDPDTRRVTYVAVRTGPLDAPHLVPVDALDATELWRGVTLPLDAGRLRDAPTVEPGLDPSDDERARARAALAPGPREGAAPT
jgi:carbon monoxide dehydrogenase subunit G